MEKSKLDLHIRPFLWTLGVRWNEPFLTRCLTIEFEGQIKSSGLKVFVYEMLNKIVILYNNFLLPLGAFELFFLFLVIQIYNFKVEDKKVFTIQTISLSHLMV